MRKAHFNSFIRSCQIGWTNHRPSKYNELNSDQNPCFGKGITLKKGIRQEAIKRRNAIPVRLRREKEENILELLKTLPLGDHVFIYKNMRSEVATDKILLWLDESGATAYLPRTELSDHSMQPHAYKPGDPLEIKNFGMAEPVNAPLEDLSQLSAILIPLLAFDRDLHRIGYGGGFYDRFLPRAPQALRIGLAFSEQEFEPLMQMTTDIPLDYIVTEKEILKRSAGRTF